MKSSVRFGVIASALLAASAASASTTVLDGKGFDIVFDSGISSFAASTALPFSLSADGKGIVFDVSSLSVSDDDALSKLSFSIVADKGYSFSSLSLNAEGSYTLTRNKKNEVDAWLLSSVSADGSTALQQSRTDKFTKVLGSKAKSDNGFWTLNNSYNIASSSLAGASTLDFYSKLQLSGFVTQKGLAQVDATRYTLSVATAPVPEPGEWAMMLAGLGMLGTIISRRSRS